MKITKIMKISAIIPVSERYDDTVALHAAYSTALRDYGVPFEMVYVIDGEYPSLVEQLKQLQRTENHLKIVQLSKGFGEAVALTSGFENSDGDVVLTLSSYFQIEAAELGKVLDAVKDVDLVTVRRWPRIDSKLTRLQGWLFNSLQNFLTGNNYRDIGCTIRAFTRQVADEVTIYGDQHRFLPVLAQSAGFSVREVDLAQSKSESYSRFYRPGVYLRRVLDLLSVFFLIKFTKKPLRFFGLVGSGITAIGGVALFIIVVQRIFSGVALADRPMLLLSSLLVVLGLQLFALGLIGELIVFTHAKHVQEYRIAEVINEDTSGDGKS